MVRKDNSRVPSKELAEILRVVRLLPAGLDLPDFWEVLTKHTLGDPKRRYAEVKEAYGMNEEDSSPRKADRANFDKDMQSALMCYEREVLEECLAGLPTDFTMYVGFGNRDSVYQTYCELVGNLATREEYAHFISASIGNYAELDAITVIKAVERYKQARTYYRKIYGVMEVFESLRSNPNKAPFSDIRLREYFSIKEIQVVENRITFINDGFSEALEGVEIDRLRICDDCRRVFWVKRINKLDSAERKVGCSTACTGRLTTRKWRATNEQKMKYKANRVLKGIRKEK